MVKKDILRVLQELKPADKIRLAEYLGLKSIGSKQSKKNKPKTYPPKENDDT